MIYEISFLYSLIFTIVIETIVIFILNRILKLKINWKILLFSGILTSFATLPYLWFVIIYFVRSRFWYVVVSELSAFLLESVIYHFILKVNFKKALIISFLCNLFSFVLGLLIF